jgi:hypothetical protein
MTSHPEPRLPDEPRRDGLRNAVLDEVMQVVGGMPTFGDERMMTVRSELLNRLLGLRLIDAAEAIRVFQEVAEAYTLGREPLAGPEDWPLGPADDLVAELRYDGSDEWHEHHVGPNLRPLVHRHVMYRSHEHLAGDSMPVRASLAALPARPEPDLDAAWREAEAELPENWALDLTFGSHGNRDGYTASAEYCYSLRYYRANVGPARSIPFEMETGPTPAAALHALAARLRSTKPG